ncbi:MAG: TIM barrel protein, partial [Deltaproteobacteria bacterium]|nr:TIM barrel protein [Deltaproteobacteria bacterium]
MFERLFVHTPFHLFDEAIETLARLELAPEIYFTASHLDQLALDQKPLDKALAQLKEYNLPCSFHGPFLDLSPAAFDPAITAVTRERFLALFDLAEILKPEVIVLHSGYERWRFNQNVNLWIEQSLKFWQPLVKRVETIGTAIAVENIFETTP